MPDEMFFTPDSRSLRRGKRVEKRTQTCRPCLVWPLDAPEIRLQGVVLDINAYGLCIRMLEALPSGSEIAVQFMRDDSFKEPLASPVDGRVVRTIPRTEGFVDHGVRLEQKTIRSAELRQAVEGPSPPRTQSRGSRMHTLDITVGNSETGRRGR